MACLQVLDPKVFPVLKEKIGDTIVTASGDTLLGADDKAGVAVMVALAQHLTNHKVPHGPVALAFGPDEEVRALKNGGRFNQRSRLVGVDD